jgi:hypothetical protein
MLLTHLYWEPSKWRGLLCIVSQSNYMGEEAIKSGRYDIYLCIWKFSLSDIYMTFNSNITPSFRCLTNLRNKFTSFNSQNAVVLPWAVGFYLTWIAHFCHVIIWNIYQETPLYCIWYAHTYVNTSRPLWSFIAVQMYRFAQPCHFKSDTCLLTYLLLFCFVFFRFFSVQFQFANTIFN